VGTTITSISSIDTLTAANATKAITAIDGALATVNTMQASLGTYQNRFTSVVDGLTTTSLNLTASRSRITDADFAQESANLSRAQVLQQAGTAMLAQANQSTSGVMALLR
jgi:flagellin